jgi:hypothetical protein
MRHECDMESKKRRGRPPGSPYAEPDAPLLADMAEFRVTGRWPWPRTTAIPDRRDPLMLARLLAPEAAGPNTTTESRARRLERAYRANSATLERAARAEHMDGQTTVAARRLKDELDRAQAWIGEFLSRNPNFSPKR